MPDIGENTPKKESPEKRPFPKKDSILVVAALNQELVSFDGMPNVNTMVTGMGKVNAAMKVTSRLRFLISVRRRPALIVNVGTVASKRFDIGTVVNPTMFIDRDLIGLPIPDFLKEDPEYQELAPDMLSGLRARGMEECLCATGDSFMSKSNLWPDNWDVVDMEAYPLARTCQEHDVKFLCIKYVSDSGNVEDWRNNLPLSGEALIKGFLKYMEDARSSYISW